MSDPASPEKLASSSLLPYWSTAYFLSVGILYLWGYWSPFKINVLEYVGLSDLVKTAAYPVVSVFVFMAISAIAGELMFPHGFMPQGGGGSTKTGLFLRRHLWLLAAVYAVATVSIFLFGPIEKWLILPALVAVPVSLSLKSTGILEDKIQHERHRSVALFLIATLPLFAYGHGAMKADDLLTGKSYLYVVSKLEAAPVAPQSTQFMKLRYIGKAGDHYFLYSPDAKTVLIVPPAEAKVLELASHQSQKVAATAPSIPAIAASAASSSGK